MAGKKSKLSPAAKLFTGLTILVAVLFVIYSIVSFTDPSTQAGTDLTAVFVSAGVLTIMIGMLLIYVMITEALDKLRADLTASEPGTSNESVETEQKRDSA